MKLTLDEIAVHVAAALEGDHNAYAALYQGLFLQFYNTAYKITGSAEDAADVVQETMLSVLCNLDRLKEHRALIAYGNRIIRNKSVDLLKAKSRLRTAEDLTMFVNQDTVQNTPEHQIITREQQENLTEVLDTLSEGLRDVVYMYYYSGMSIAEIAQALDLQKDAVKTRLSRARQQLKERLIQDESPAGGKRPDYKLRSVNTAAPIVLLMLLRKSEVPLPTAQIQFSVWQEVCRQIQIDSSILPLEHFVAKGVVKLSLTGGAKLQLTKVVCTGVAAAGIGLGLFHVTQNPSDNAGFSVPPAPPQQVMQVGVDPAKPVLEPVQALPEEPEEQPVAPLPADEAVPAAHSPELPAAEQTDPVPVEPADEVPPQVIVPPDLDDTVVEEPQPSGEPVYQVYVGGGQARAQMTLSDEYTLAWNQSIVLAVSDDAPLPEAGAVWQEVRALIQPAVYNQWDTVLSVPTAVIAQSGQSDGVIAQTGVYTLRYRIEFTIEETSFSQSVEVQLSVKGL